MAAFNEVLMGLSAALYLVLMLLKLEHNKYKSNQICKEEDRTCMYCIIPYTISEDQDHTTTKPLDHRYKYLIDLISNTY